MNFELVEGDVEAGGEGGSLEGFAEEIGGVDLHAGRDLVAEERHEEEIELAGLADMLDAGVAKADGFAFGVGNEGDLGGGSEREADAAAGDGGAEPGVNLNLDEDAVGGKGELRILREDRAGGLGVALEVVAAVGTAEELLLEGALEGGAAHLEVDGVGRRREGKKAESEDQSGAMPVKGKAEFCGHRFNGIDYGSSAWEVRAWAGDGSHSRLGLRD